MLLSLDAAAQQEFPVVIVGSGPAGISVALDLERRGIRCLILEAGDLRFSEDSQSFCDGKVVGDPYFDLKSTRLRQFGGTSGHWAGYCRPLDPHDLRDWPLSHEDLGRYLVPACELLEIPAEFADIAINQDLKQIVFQASPPVRFADKFSDHITKSDRIGLVVRAPVRELQADGARVLAVLAGDNAIVPIRGRRFVLCAGGIENSRLMLWSRLRSGGVLFGGLPLGLYWMDHPHQLEAGAAIASSLQVQRRLDARLKRFNTLFIAPTPEFMRREGIDNAGLRLRVGDKALAKELIRDLACIAPELGGAFYRLWRRELSCSFDVGVAWEQPPTLENRVELDVDKDRLGIPKARLCWRQSEATRRTARLCVERVGQWLVAERIGRIAMSETLLAGHAYPRDSWMAGPHHMGGTRMGRRSDDSVVDADLKVHGMKNLYVGGSSVFRSGGHANPTLTIVQLSLRLGEHLAQVAVSTQSA